MTPAEIDDDVIEATIRRVAAAKAAQAAAEVDTEAPQSNEAADPEAHVAAAAPIEPEPTSVAIEPPPPSAPTSIRAGAAGVRDDVGVVDTQPWQAALARLEEEVADLRGALAALTARVEGGLTTPSGAGRGTPMMDESDDDWEETPALRAMPAGPPRPAIFRDAVARAPVEPQPIVDAGDVEIDTRPLPEPPPPIRVEQKRGLDLLPRTYRITVEDKRRGVDLVPLHRALLGMENVRDMSLLSFANGVAIVSLETVDELDPHALEQSVSHAMSRPARVETHNEFTFVVKLAEE